VTPASASLAGLLARIERIASEAVSDPCAAAMEREVLALWEGARRNEQRRSLRAVLEALGSNLEDLTQPGRPIERIGRMGFAWWPADELAAKWDPWRDERASGKRAGNRNAAILVIDDLGAELADDRTVAAFERVVEHRVDLKTIITTNASPAVLRARYGARVGERIGHHGGMLITFDGPSRRRAAAW